MSEYVEHDSTGAGVGLTERRLFAANRGLTLESGQALPRFELAYETYGTLSPKADNVVLVLHALTGDAHAAGINDPADPKPGWWDIAIGPGKAVDTDKYFVVCSNVLGGCMGSTGPSTENPATGRPYGLDFPVVTIGDMVSAQIALIDHLGIDRLLAVIGGSMGGMQALEWSVRAPDRLAAVIPLAATPRHSALNIAFHEIARQAIMADPNWNRGDYYEKAKPETGLAVARMIGHVTYLSDDAMRRKFGRRLQDRDVFSFNFEEDPDFQVESYLKHQGRKFVERFDANSFLYVTKAADYFDLAARHGGGSLAAAFAKAKARFLVASFSSDWLYPTYRSREIVSALKKNGLDVSFVELAADAGHDAFLLPDQRLFDLLSGFLESVYAYVARS